MHYVNTPRHGQESTLWMHFLKWPQWENKPHLLVWVLLENTVILWLLYNIFWHVSTFILYDSLLLITLKIRNSLIYSSPISVGLIAIFFFSACCCCRCAELFCSEGNGSPASPFAVTGLLSCVLTELPLCRAGVISVSASSSLSEEHSSSDESLMTRTLLVSHGFLRTEPWP